MKTFSNMNIMRHKILLTACLALLTTGFATAGEVNTEQSKDDKKTSTTQRKENLHHEITLQRDFDPVVKKAVKKNSLPVVKRQQTTELVDLQYSTWAQPLQVPGEIPTMLPYGYRTSHDFSNYRGYVDFGAGSQLNVLGSAGYRFIDNERTTLNAWLQHNSTWMGKNSTRLPVEYRAKQKFNDNTLGIDLTHEFETGSLSANAMFNIDQYNYYAGVNKQLSDLDNTFIHTTLGAEWNSKLKAFDKEINYVATFNHDYISYDKAINNPLIYKSGLKEHFLKLGLAGDYDLTSKSNVGVNLIGSLYHTSIKLASTAPDDAYDPSGDIGQIHINPFYLYKTDNYRALLGANIDVCINDGPVLLFSPNVQFDLNIMDGLSLIAKAQGGKWATSSAGDHLLSRYIDPTYSTENTYSPIDAEVSLIIGPFAGLKLGVNGGYGIFKHNDIIIDYRLASTLADNPVFPEGTSWHLPYLSFLTTKNRGFKVGGFFEYKYRSWGEITANYTFAPQDDDDLSSPRWMNSYFLGLDGAEHLLDVNLKVYPIKPLTLNVGFEYRGDRSVMVTDVDALPTYYGEIDLEHVYIYRRTMADVINLKAGANYRFDSRFSIWLQAANLLNKQWDVFPYMGTQKFNFMGGISYVF